MRLKLELQNVPQPDVFARMLCQQIVRPGQSFEPASEPLGELLKARARIGRATRQRLDVREQVPHPQLGQQQIAPFHRLRELAVRPEALDRRGEEIGIGLEEDDVVVAELPAGGRVHLENPPAPCPLLITTLTILLTP